MILNTHENRELLIDTLCEVFSLTRKVLMSRSRLRHVVMARAIGYKVGRDIFGMTLTACAELFRAHNSPLRNHTTVMHSIENLNDLASVGDEVVIGMTNEVMKKMELMAKKGLVVIVHVHPDDLMELTGKLQKWNYEYEVADKGVNLTEVKN